MNQRHGLQPSAKISADLFHGHRNCFSQNQAQHAAYFGDECLFFSWPNFQIFGLCAKATNQSPRGSYFRILQTIVSKAFEATRRKETKMFFAGNISCFKEVSCDPSVLQFSLWVSHALLWLHIPFLCHYSRSWWSVNKSLCWDWWCYHVKIDNK